MLFDFPHSRRSSLAPEGEERDLRLILLSACKHASKSSIRRLKNSPVAHDIYDPTRFPMYTWCLLNVMLVDWEGDYAERIAVGQLHADAWQAATPTTELIQLA